MTYKKLSPVERFWMLLKPDKREIRNIYIYAIIIGLLNLVLPLGIQSIINLIQGGAVSTSWFVLILIVALAITVSGILQINQLRITENLQQKIFTRAAFEFTYRIPKIRLEQLFKAYAPELMNRFFDIVSIQKSITKILIEFSSASIQVFFGLILLSLYHPFFILFSFLLVFMVFIIFKLTIYKGLETSLEESKQKYRLAHWLEEIARSNTSFKLAGSSALTMQKTNAFSGEYIDSRESHFGILRQQYGWMVGFKVLVAIGLLLIGGLLVIEQQMNIGQFVAAEIVILLIVSSVEKVILSFDNIYDVLTSLDKIGQVVDLELEKDGGLRLDKLTEGVRIEMNNVSFQYEENGKKVLNGIDLTVKRNERLFISGQSDSGKSTLMQIICGLMTPTDGTVTIDDIPIKNYDFNALRSVIGGNLRDETLFEGSLMDNISLGRRNATFENVKWAIKGVGLEDFVANLPDGYDTQILSSGKNFSKSTVSKLLIARAIADRPKLLLLENSFSVFTEQDRKNIITFLMDRQLQWTVIITSSQDIFFSDLMDRRIYLKNGLLHH